MFNSRIGAGIILLGLTAGSVLAQQTQITQDGRPERVFRIVSGLDNEDLKFMKNAAIANMFEIQSSELAAQKSQDPFVLEFAKEMINDHTESLEELKGVALQKGVNLPSNLPGPLEHSLEHLQNLSGAAFDNAYQRAQKYGHEDASRLFHTEIEHGHDQDVKGYAVKTLPAVMMHYKMTLTHTTQMGPTQMKGGG